MTKVAMKGSSIGRDAMAAEETLSRLQYCLAVIERRLADDRRRDRWLWELRQNVALFALRRLQRAGAQSNEPPLSEAERLDVLAAHPLLAPLAPPVSGVSELR